MGCDSQEAAVLQCLETQATPAVSVIIPAYNAEATIKASIDSVLMQTFTDWELIIVDDCSTDSTVSIAMAFAAEDSRIRLLQNPKNAGVAATRNKALSHAQGKWIAFLDSDDLWRSDKLELQLQFAEEMDAKITYTGTAYMNATGEMFNYYLPAVTKLSYKALLRRNLMSCSSVMVRRDVMVPFPQGYMHEDYAVWMQILRNEGCAYGLDEPLLIYRMSGQSKSSNRVRSAKMTYNAYKHAGYGVLTSLSLTARYALHSIIKRTGIRMSMNYAGEE